MRDNGDNGDKGQGKVLVWSFCEPSLCDNGTKHGID
jgi:hypothetical protein